MEKQPNRDQVYHQTEDEIKRKPWLQRLFMLSDRGYKDLKVGTAACTLTNISMMLPFMVIILIIMEIIKPLIGETMSWSRMWMLFAAGIGAALVVFLFTKFDYKKTYVASYMESENTRTSMAEHIRRLPMSVFNSKDLSEMTTNLMGDVTTSEHVLSHVAPQLFANAISITLICAMMAIFDWRMALAVFISVPVAFLIVLIARKIYDNISKRQAQSKLDASDQVQEYIDGIKVIRACNLDGEKFSALENALRKMKALAIKLEVGTGVFVTGAQVVLQAGIGLTVLVGVNLLTAGTLELIPMLMFVLIVVRIYGPIMTELTLLPELFYHQIAINRMRKLMDYKPMEGSTTTELNNFDIAFKDVAFSYNKDNQTMKDITTTIPSDGITALVGPSGSGKSTMARLIARFWDVNEGEITIDGVDIKTIEPEHLMSYMSFVFQDVILFNDTVYNNIRIGNMEASHEEIIAAAKIANCDEFVSRMADGYDTMLGENGATLSGGERQRISIARAILKDAPIILLDEATASLDPENEASIQEAISRLIEGKTVIVIAHKLRTIEKADKIIVLEEGKIAEEGTHDELFSKGGLYSKLYTIQQDSLGWSV